MLEPAACAALRWIKFVFVATGALLIWINVAIGKDCCTDKAALHTPGANPMQQIAYLRELAAKYREVAARWAKVEKPQQAVEYEELAETCEEVAAEIEDHIPAG
jgi:hypothetical protein